MIFGSQVFFAFFMRFNADIVFKRDLLVAFQRRRAVSCLCLRDLSAVPGISSHPWRRATSLRRQSGSLSLVSWVQLSWVQPFGWSWNFWITESLGACHFVNSSILGKVVTLYKKDLGTSHSYSKYRELGMVTWTAVPQNASACHDVLPGVSRGWEPNRALGRSSQRFPTPWQGATVTSHSRICGNEIM